MVEGSPDSFPHSIRIMFVVSNAIVDLLARQLSLHLHSSLLAFTKVLILLSILIPTCSTPLDSDSIDKLITISKFFRRCGSFDNRLFVFQVRGVLVPVKFSFLRSSRSIRVVVGPLIVSGEFQTIIVSGHLRQKLKTTSALSHGANNINTLSRF